MREMDARLIQGQNDTALLHSCYSEYSSTVDQYYLYGRYIYLRGRDDQDVVNLWDRDKMVSATQGYEDARADYGGQIPTIEDLQSQTKQGSR